MKEEVDKINTYVENWMALVVSICTQKNASEALRDMGIVESRSYNCTKRDEKYMIDKELLEQYYNEGRTFDEMAELMDCSKTTIYKRLKSYDIKLIRKVRR